MLVLFFFKTFLACAFPIKTFFTYCTLYTHSSLVKNMVGTLLPGPVNCKKTPRGWGGGGGGGLQKLLIKNKYTKLVVNFA
jgi:hypothetical protein